MEHFDDDIGGMVRVLRATMFLAQGGEDAVEIAQEILGTDSIDDFDLAGALRDRRDREAAQRWYADNAEDDAGGHS